MNATNKNVFWDLDLSMVLYIISYVKQLIYLNSFKWKGPNVSSQKLPFLKINGLEGWNQIFLTGKAYMNLLHFEELRIDGDSKIFVYHHKLLCLSLFMSHIRFDWHLSNLIQVLD